MYVIAQLNCVLLCRTCRESPEKWARFSDDTFAQFSGGLLPFSSRQISLKAREDAEQDCQIKGKESATAIELGY